MRRFVLTFRDGDDEFTETEEMDGFGEALHKASETLARLSEGRPQVYVAIGEDLETGGTRWLGTVHLNDARKPVWIPEGGIH